MNLKNIGLVAAGANQALKYLREQNDKRERNIYDSLLENLKEGNLHDLHNKLDSDELQELYGAARAQAGEITRDAHDRLDRRRAAFAAAAPSRKERQELLQKASKDKKKGGVGKVVGATLGTAALAGCAWAAWEFFLKDKLAGDDEPVETYRPAPTRTETDSQGSTTVVYSTRTEDDLEGGTSRLASTSGTSTDYDNDTDLGGEGLTTLDTLADNQRKATDAREDVEADAQLQHNEDGGADFGRHELRD